MHTIEFAVIIKETEKAVLVQAPTLDEDTWVPKRCIHDESEIWRDGEVGTIGIKASWAEKAGLI